jgi:chorismate dehydratase
MKRLRISAISYLNTAPLMWDFEHGDAGAAFDLSYTVPSNCAAQLQEGSADIGIIPAAAYLTVPNLAIIPGVAIASRMAVRSILLVSNVPLDSIQTIALDASSLTSVALIKVLFARWWGGLRTFVSAPPNLNAMLENNDAALVIGDPALKVDRSQYLTYDLAEEWIRLTGRPFVFAFWAVRQEALVNLPSALDLAAIFSQSRDHGLEAQNIALLTQQWAPRLGLNEQDIKSYLTQNIHYFLDADCIEGMKLFFQYAEECGAVPAGRRLEFLDMARHP